VEDGVARIQNSRFLRRWHNEKIERMFRDDIMSTEQVRDLGRMKLLSDMLPERVGSLFSVNAVREELEAGFKAVSNWILILESFYYQFRIRPFVHRRMKTSRLTFFISRKSSRSPLLAN
jgi:predicted AAA+ superfamily ATPase